MDRQAVVTLFPVGEKEALPFRSLTFASANDTFTVGRASKREEKNMVPEHHNAYFDSRVMSRQHATLGVSADMKTVYVRDMGSMHGTFVNDKRIASDQNHTIQNGDVVTFGAAVTRGDDTYKPLKVRCEYEWFDNRHARVLKPAVEQKTNKFSVPEDDDDVEVVEVVDTTIIDEVEDAEVDDGEDSEVWSDDEVDAAAERSSPVTSPSSERFEHGKRELEVNAEQGEDELPMVSICQTSTSVASPNESHIERHETTRVTVCSAQSSPEPAEPDHSGNEEHDLVLPENQSDVGPNDERRELLDDEVVYEEMDQVYDEIFSAVAADSIDEPNSAHDESEIGSGESRHTNMPKSNTGGLKTGSSNKPPPSSFDCPSVQISEPPLNAYKDGPFVNSAVLACTTSTAVLVPCLASDHPRGTKQDNQINEAQGLKSSENSVQSRPTQDSGASNVSQTVNPAVCHASPNKPTKQRTGFSVADLVNAKSTRSPSNGEPERDVKKSSKRKASCLEFDSDGNDSLGSISNGSFMTNPVLPLQDRTPDSSDAYSQDAQPRVVLDTPSQPDSEVLALSHVGHVPVAVSTSTHRPPSKRVKTNEPTRAKSFASHAATAIVGAIVGGLSTVALLASLPPDYFN